MCFVHWCSPSPDEKDAQHRVHRQMNLGWWGSGHLRSLHSMMSDLCRMQLFLLDNAPQAALQWPIPDLPSMPPHRQLFKEQIDQYWNVD